MAATTDLKIRFERELEAEARGMRLGADGALMHTEAQLDGALMHTEAQIDGALMHTEAQIDGALMHSENGANER